MPPLPPPAIHPSTAFVPIFNINWSSCPFANVTGLRCYEFYLAETEEERYLKTILEDHVKFPTFPRRLNDDVIVDHHPEYLPITPQESDVISNVSLAIFGNFASLIQNRKPVKLCLRMS